MNSKRHAGGLPAGRRGSVLMLVVVLLSLLAMIPLAMQLISTSRQNTETQLKMVGQADNFARAGLMDGVNWFRRQTQTVQSQLNPGLYPYPDAAFNPQTSTNTAQSDTIDASIGIVQEYQIDPANWLYGRYEVRQQHDPTINPIDPHAVHDITNLRVPGKAAGAGLVWYIESTGIVYRKRNPALAYNVAPNEVVGTARIATEIRQVSLSLPVQSAVFVNVMSAANDSLQNNGRIVGGNNVGIAYNSTTGNPTIGTGSGVSVSGGGIQYEHAAWSEIGVFGVNAHDLGLMADYSVASVASLPAGYPAQAIVFINTPGGVGTAAFDAGHKLIGGGILFVYGNLTINSTAATFFSGAIYASGNVIINGPATIAGVVIAGGTLTLNGSGDVVTIQQSSSIVASVQQQVARYRECRSEYYTFTAIK